MEGCPTIVVTEIDKSFARSVFTSRSVRMCADYQSQMNHLQFPFLPGTSHLLLLIVLYIVHI